MIVFIRLENPEGQPIAGARVVHFRGCCDADTTWEEVGGENPGYKITIPGPAQTHRIVAQAAGYQTGWTRVTRGALEIASSERTLVLQPVEQEDAALPPGHGAGRDPGIGGLGWKIGEIEIPAVRCHAIALSTKKPCRRRTTQDYCYQHDGKVTPEMKKYVGQWKMSGRQVHVERSGWEADLELRANGTLAWKETKGANVGAKRTGSWTVENKRFDMRYRAPNVGRVDWEAKNPTAQTMSGAYRTPEAGPKGYGWGGEWSARKRAEKA